MNQFALVMSTGIAWGVCLLMGGLCIAWERERLGVALIAAGCVLFFGAVAYGALA